MMYSEQIKKGITLLNSRFTQNTIEKTQNTQEPDWNTLLRWRMMWRWRYEGVPGGEGEYFLFVNIGCWFFFFFVSVTEEGVWSGRTYFWQGWSVIKAASLYNMSIFYL